MKIQYYGTAAAEGWPGVFCRCEFCKEASRLGGKNLRTRSQALIDDVLLVDFPADSYLHMLYYGLRLPEIQHLIITHSHQDHFYPADLAERRDGMCLELNGVLHIYGNERVKEKLNHYTTSENMNLKESVSFHPLKAFEAFSAGDHTVTPLPAFHDTRENCLIYLVERDGEALVYGNDSGFFPEDTLEYLAGKKLDIVSFDCTFGTFNSTYKRHMGLLDNELLLERLKEIGCVHSKTKCVVTHFSHHGCALHDELEKAAGKLGFIAAYDGMIVE
jgi:phosphoribosyl 1,2-cyclic phosphate phosphodiesterase